ncbi:MAG: sigma-54-dependent Fis family transcriptional regulator [Candidatus Thiodiazotropha taylori]|uniref:Sigma-54-dependent Fis family transcriptional regulator n=1 Tax=Candidatus Thiodiazotropha taylori TaxID=2792791 RepID=A0A9E4N3P0_9GAMM|nr:sigma-54-dependent Fis family transcriptional regulator [Candidatus Thiodiazotropha taylori]MCG7965742.1 sigma-54-dependent Fis family transcriptional regulator [Candidatus Thiodiazotropha taylori]MCG8042843.1 sigma-54-dependent Fis family transcriptional regulator [Candidatus Thiodiazotropha taylori]MCG8050079.1 sigma-54-dependent Fis family transcriptional regulator [Candidatus Thiodiazotropha taylori]MCG8057859.1 sigma-54-dependent Fis family transcriptional regulator [Candidatus Thiodiaz
MESSILSQDISSHEDLVRAALSGNHIVQSADIDDITLRSWRRCTDEYGLDPGTSPDPVIINRQDLRERLQKYERLLDIARIEMTDLYQQLAGSGHAIMLTDKDGILLNFIGDPQFTDAAAHAGMQLGAVWSETVQGTNGMGTCLIEQKPLVIHKQSHFFARNASLTCSAAPIFDPHGEILAVLDASSESKMAQQHTMVLLNMSAQVIENRVFFCAMREAFVLRFHSRSEFISTLGEGAIAFNSEGEIQAINRSAMFQLNLESPHEIVGHHIQQHFTTSLTSLLKQANSHAFPVRETQHGKRFFATLQLPEKTCRNQRRSAPWEAKGSQLKPTSSPAPDALNALHFNEPRMARNVKTAIKLIERDIPCMLFGETGTGKEMFARALHNASSRYNNAFVAVNCASLPESLIESELFGYRPGAFTGANREGSRGKILQADGGTLFLDEIGDMPLHLQARLLRVLEEREVTPLGGEKPVRVSIKLISATHHDIQSMVEEGTFREDLYYRLHGLSLTMPALRDRTDKVDLIKHLGQLEAGTNEALEWEPEALKILENFRWPGNIRQLRNVMRTVTALCDESRVTPDDLPDEVRETTFYDELSESSEAPLNALAIAERDALLVELEEMHWNISRVAKKLDLSRNTLYRRMKRFGISPPR